MGLNNQNQTVAHGFLYITRDDCSAPVRGADPLRQKRAHAQRPASRQRTPEVARAWISSIAPIISALTGLIGVIIGLLAIILGRR
jgi:hypothetical protein